MLRASNCDHEPSDALMLLRRDDRWYERFVPIADRLYDEHLRTIKREGL